MSLQVYGLVKWILVGFQDAKESGNERLAWVLRWDFRPFDAIQHFISEQFAKNNPARELSQPVIGTITPGSNWRRCPP
jgi:hypothetical protein